MFGAKGMMYANCTQVIMKKYYTHIRVCRYVYMYRETRTETKTETVDDIANMAIS